MTAVVTLSNGTVQRSGGSCGFGKGQVGIGGPVKSMPKPNTERAVVDRAPNLEQQIGTSSRPSHLLGLVHAPVDQEIRAWFEMRHFWVTRASGSRRPSKPD